MTTTQWEHPCFDGWSEEGVIDCYEYDPSVNRDDCLHLKKGCHWWNCSSGREHKAFDSYQRGVISNNPPQREEQ
jgi:hypothetical protein